MEQGNTKFTKYFICSMIQVFLIPLYGFVPLYLTIVANTAWKTGRYEACEKLNSIVKILLTIGFVFIAVVSVVLTVGLIHLFYTM